MLDKTKELDVKFKSILEEVLKDVEFCYSPIGIKSFLEEQLSCYKDRATLHDNANEYFSKHLEKIPHGEYLKVGYHKCGRKTEIMIVNSPTKPHNSNWSKDNGYSSGGKRYYQTVLKNGSNLRVFSPDSDSKRFGVYFISAIVNLSKNKECN